MGWGHALDRFILPAGWAGTATQQQQILEVYKPFRMAAGVLGGVVVVGTLAGIVIGGLVFGGVIVWILHSSMGGTFSWHCSGLLGLFLLGSHESDFY
jgi:hypothetical protein